MSVEIGDKVMYKKDMGGTPIKLDEVNYLLFSEHELLMVIKTKVD
jgi:co-chaperonin GroES (HSP10)